MPNKTINLPYNKEDHQEAVSLRQPQEKDHHRKRQKLQPNMTTNR